MSHVVIEQVYSTLMALDPDAKPYPELAESYEVSDDGLSYTFKLRQGVKFHNGDDLTADDVKFSFDRLRAKDSGYSYGAQVETIASVDVDRSAHGAVQAVEAHRPVPHLHGLPRLLDRAEEAGRVRPRPERPAGRQRPLQVRQLPAALRPSSSRRTRHYFEEGKPYFDAMEYRIISDITALTNAVMSGEVNFSNEIPPKDWATVQGNADLVGVTLEGSRYYWLLCNTTKAPLDNPKVRQAIAQAIDRNALVEGRLLRPGDADPRRRHSGVELGLCRHPVLQAERRSREGQGAAGRGRPSRRLRDIDDDRLVVPGQMAMAPIIQANLAAVGIKAKIGTMEIPRYWDEVWSTSNFDITSMYWLSPLADPDDFVTNNYKCGMAINVQKILQQGDGRAAGGGEGGRDGGRAQGTATSRCTQLSLDDMGQVPLVNGWLLIAHTQQAAELQADAHGLPEDAEGRLVRGLTEYAALRGPDAHSGRGRTNAPRHF